MTTRFADHLLEGDHASRPTATTVPTGTLYACSDHNLIYQSDGATWSTWATLSAGGSTLTTDGDTLIYDGGLARLPVGSDDDVMTVVAGIPAWSAPTGGSGTTIVNGAYVPTGSDGSVGDYFLNTSGKILYGPKISAASFFDDFNRADAALTTPWTNRVGVCAVVSNQAAYSSGTAPAIATVDGAANDTVIGTIATTQGDTGVVFRYVDVNNFWLIFRDSLYRGVAGTFAAQGSWTSTPSVKAVLLGSSIIIKNATTDATLLSITDSNHVSATKHGVRLNGAGRIDDLRVDTPAWPVALISA